MPSRWGFPTEKINIIQAVEMLPPHSHSFEESEFSDDDYSVLDFEETGSESGGIDSGLERSYIEDKDDSTITGSAEEETSSEIGQEEGEIASEEDFNHARTPTPTNGVTPIVDLGALQAQVSLLKEFLERDRLAYETKLSDLEEAQNIVAQKCRILEFNSRDGFGIQTYVDLLRTRSNDISQRVWRVEEKFSSGGELKELKQFDDVLSARIASKADLAHLKHILESLSVEQQRLKNIQVANSKTLETLGLQIQFHELINKPNTSPIEDMNRERLDKQEERMVDFQASLKRFESYVVETEEEFTQVSTEFDDNLQALQRSREIEEQLNSRVTLLTSRFDKHEELFAKELAAQNTLASEHAEDLGIRLMGFVDFKCQSIQDFLKAEVDKANKDFTQRLASLEQHLISESANLLVTDARDQLRRRESDELSARLTVCEKAVAQLQKASLDTIRACKPAVHDCANVAQQVDELLVWKASMTGKENACHHCNVREESLERWIKEFESKDQEWKRQTRDGLKDYIKKMQGTINEWVHTVEHRFSELDSLQQKKFAERNAEFLGNVNKTLKGMRKGLTQLDGQIEDK